jgi:hypothetical protein
MKAIIALPVLALSIAASASHVKAEVQSNTCGENGTVPQRIVDCAYFKKGNFVLVTRTATAIEVYMDATTGLIWSERLATKLTHFKAEAACKSKRAEFANLPNLTWRLPTISEYKVAESNGIRKSLKGWNDWFWSLTSISYDDFYAYMFNGIDGTVDGYTKNYSFSVRCVAK